MSLFSESLPALITWLEAHKHFKIETAGLEDELCSWGLYMMFLLRQIYTEDILLLDALLCHVW